jgi:hypothetical protein
VPRPRGDAATAGGPAEQVASRTVGAELIGHQPLVFLASRKQHSAGTVTEKREAFLIPGVNHPAVTISSDHQGAFAVPRRDKLRSDHECEHKTRTGRLHIKRRAGQLEPVLNQVGRGRERHVRCEGRDDQEVNIGWLATGGFQAPGRRLDAEIAGRLMRQGEPPLVDSCPVDDPLGIKTVRLAQVLIGHNQLRDVAPCTENPHAHKRAR